MRSTQLLFSFLLSSACLLILVGKAQAQPQPVENEPAPVAESVAPEDQSREVETSFQGMAQSGSLALQSGSMRSQASDWMVMPEGVTTLGANLGFLTAPGKPGEGGIALTDVVLASVSVHRALAERLEINLGASFLPKQPSYSNEMAWQSANAGARIGFDERYAFDLDAGGGSILDRNGYWASGSGGLSARKSLDRTLVLEGTAGGSYTSLFEDDRSKPTWLVEASVAGRLTFRAPNGMAATWVSAGFNIPLADGSSMSSGGQAAYDPHTRVNLEIGGVLSYIDDWDIWSTYTVLDRGDQIESTTTMPVLTGGSDQRQFLFGLIYHLREEGKKVRPPLHMAL